MSDITLLGVPIEEGAGRRGCAMGPAAFRTAGLIEDLQALGHTVADLGDVTPDTVAFDDDRLVRPDRVAGWSRAVFRHARDLAQGGTLPIYMGGDHAMALGSIAGQLAGAQIKDRPLFVLWLDAHSDFNTPETSPSGNMHGMPLAYLTGLADAAPVLGEPLPAVLDPRNICMLGLRSVDADERRQLQASGAAAHDMRAIDETGIAKLLRPFLDHVRAASGALHVSLDVDFLDPAIAPAVGTTVPGGATFREAHLVMEMLHDSGCVSSLDLVELNPFLDERGRTARLMVDLTASLFGRTVLDRPTTSF